MLSTIKDVGQGMGRLLKVVFGFLAVVIFILAVGTGLLYHHFARDLPKFTDINDYKPLIVSELFSEDGTKIGEFWQECRYLLPYDQIPPRIANAFIASEDERFWEHKGVDFRSILRAMVENLRAGHVVQGGSTITQQVTRSLVLSREKSFDRKIKEAILATQIEQNLTKEQILYIYLNQIFLGNRSYGVQAAARNYFHKNVKDLNLAEIAMIAGLPSAPTTYSPIHNIPMARERQFRVLERMLDNGYITKAEYEEAMKAPLTLYRAGTDKDFNMKYAPYFVEHVRRHIGETYGENTLYYGGLKIETTASLIANQAADRAVKRGLLEVERRKGFHGPITLIPKDKIAEFAESVHWELAGFDEPIRIPEDPHASPLPTPIEDWQIYKGIIAAVDPKGSATVLVGRTQGVITPEDRAWTGRTPKVGEVYWVRQKSDGHFAIEVEPKLEAALFSYNPLTGEVKAMIGGFSFKKSEFNRATQALRQPGSAFKPFIYSAALDKGYTPGTMVLDAPVVYQVGKNDTWSPKNYTSKYNGPMTIRNALAHSVNIVAVKVFHDIGIDYAVAYARKLGFVSPIAKYLSSALGASDVTLQELTRSYGTFPAGGVRPELIFVRKITDKDGKSLEENEPYSLNAEHVFDPPTNNSHQKFNTDLMIEGEKFIKQDRLKLSPDEMSILFGSAIPPGHVITPQTSFLMVNLMRSVVDFGTGVKARELKRPAAGKTGTTNEESDAWFIGYVPDLIAGVWLGYDNHKKIGEKMTGGVISAPIWLYYMQEVLKGQAVKNFATPPDIKLSEIDTMSGGSAPEDLKPQPEETPQGAAPASRGVDFLYKDSNGL
jgi:penicillin-binding protein 1A